MSALRWLSAAGSAALVTLSGCGALEFSAPRDLRWVTGDTSRQAIGRGALSLRWTQRLVPTFDDAYLPVQTATPALDPARDRIYAASTTGTLWALRGNGRRVYRYEAGASFEAGPVLDAGKQQIYAVSEDGVVHALDARNGKLRWKVDSGAGATRRSILLVPDAAYVVSETDQVVALSREQGEVLWRYKRDPTDGYHVVGHAGLTLSGDQLLAAFSDGTVVALDASDGRVRWERETALDFPPGEAGRGQRFVDTDTTPVVIGDVVYVASFSGGLYGLNVDGGGVVSHRPELIGVTSITATGTDLVVATADGRLKRIDSEAGTERWSRRISRGTSGATVLRSDLLYSSETQGGFVVRSAATGMELSRIEAGHGFSAAPAFAESRGFVLSNGGTLFAFSAPVR